MKEALKKTTVWLVKNIVKKKNMWLFDIILICLAYISVVMVVFPVFKLGVVISSSVWFILFAVCVYIAFMHLFGNYRIIWKFATSRDYSNVIFACIMSGIVVTAFSMLTQQKYYYAKVSVMASCMALCLLIAYRVAVKICDGILRQYFINNSSRNNLLIVGAGNAAVMFVNCEKLDDSLNYNIVGFVDDDPAKQGALIDGIKVLGTRDDIADICKGCNVSEILIAIPSISISERGKIIEICTATDCKIKLMPSLDNLVKDTDLPQIRPVNIDDLLARDPIVLDDCGIDTIINGKTIMVTGGGGSIGSELCRQLVKYNPALLIILDIYENNAYELQNELTRDYPKQKTCVLIASVRDKERLNVIFEQYRPDVVYHAAAHKHVPLMEFSPGEAIKNNVFGTMNVAKCADEYKVSKFVMISTDKAVNPTNVMGATKRMCELIVQAMQKVSDTQFVAVRFGNVLGSNGSVIPLFEKQIEKGGPVTVTHKEITRFFMTIPEAAQLVIQASCFAAGGEIFVLDMGQPVKIYDLAKNLIRLSGYSPDKDIKIEITGLRPGEKLYEELLMDEEGLEKTRHSKIYIGKPLDINMEEISQKLKELTAAVETNDNENIRIALAKAVPTYTPDKKHNCSIEMAET